MSLKSELAWKLADYQNAGVEPPEELIVDPTLCEGEMMTLEDVAGHIKDSTGTLMILLDHNSTRFEETRLAFLADLAFLLELGKIDPDEYNEITSSEELNP